MTWLRAAVFGLLHVALAVASLSGDALWFVVVLAVVTGAEVLLRDRYRKVYRALEALQVGRVPRLVARVALLVLLTVRAQDAPAWLFGATVLAAAALLVGRAVVAAEVHRLRERTVWPLRWRRLDVPALAERPEHGPGARARAVGPEVVDALDLVLAAGVALVLTGHHAGWAAAALTLAAVVVLVVAVALRGRRTALPLRTRDEVVAHVRSAVEQVAPQVVAYFGGPPSSTHALNVWVEALEGLDVPVLVVVRQPVHLEKLESARLPAVWAPRATDVEALVVPSIRLALYPTNIAQNNHLIRLPGITDVFVGHGDSDKGGSATPLSRIYDEVWVAGPAARERYRTADVGVRDEQIREVGRPQLAHITRRGTMAEDRPFTVLYAPTWEGFYSSWSYSSLQSMGERIVSGLLGLDGVRVLVKPHPASGSVDKAYGRASRRVVDAVRAAGDPHRVVDGLTGLYEAFNDADLLVTDVSSVVTDFLWSGKPYVMTNPSGMAEADYRQEFPSSAGAALWTPDLASLAADVEDARTTDVRRADRETVARHLLGDRTGDAAAGFAAAVHAVLGQGPADPRNTSTAPSDAASEPFAVSLPDR
jgi:hypothetical protein